MKITDGVVATNIAWRFAERFLAQGISFIVSLVLARILVPDDYAAVSIITVILTFFDGITTRGFSQALVQKDQVDQLDYSSLFYTNILITGVMYAALYVASPWLAAFYAHFDFCIQFDSTGLRTTEHDVSQVFLVYACRNAFIGNRCCLGCYARGRCVGTCYFLIGQCRNRYNCTVFHDTATTHACIFLAESETLFWIRYAHDAYIVARISLQ